MKRVLALTLAACILAVFAIGCNSDGGSEETKTSETGSVEITSTPEVSSTVEDDGATNVPEGTGGTRIRSRYSAMFSDDMYGLSSKLISLVGENGGEIVDQWVDEEFKIRDPDQSKRIAVSILDFIKEFDIPKEAFSEQAGSKLTQEEIDALYSDDLQDVREAFVSDYAILVGETIYTPRMLFGLTFDELKAIGITESDIEGKMDLWGMEFYTTEFYDDMVEICEQNNISFTKNENYIQFKANGSTYQVVPDTFKEGPYERYYTTESE